MSLTLFPDSRLRTVMTPKAAIPTWFGWQVPIYCASCGTPAGCVPEENMTFAFYLCNECFKTHGDSTLFMTMPDQVFWATVAEAQLEKYGRYLSAEEVVEKLTDPESLESRLARDRKFLTPHAGE